jgi:hypothetical protein
MSIEKDEIWTWTGSGHGHGKMSGTNMGLDHGYGQGPEQDTRTCETAESPCKPFQTNTTFTVCEMSFFLYFLASP